MITSSWTVIALTLLNFGFWYYLGRTRTCPKEVSSSSQPPDSITSTPPQLFAVPSSSIDSFRSERFVAYTSLLPRSTILNSHSSSCQSYSSLYVESHDQCLAVVQVRKAKAPYNLLRYDSSSSIHMKERNEVFQLPPSMHLPVGFFLKVVQRISNIYQLMSDAR